MNKRNFFSKAITWLLITALVNPAAMAPAFARDTDIFMVTNTGSTVAEPNIMIVLDTSDSMNLFEDWREYPGAYDSHVEYLWNDLTVIGNSTQPNYVSENSSYISSGVGPVVTSITRVGNLATVQFAANHNYQILPTPWTVAVYNATDPLYNGSFPINSMPTSTRITYVMTGTPAANAVATGGTLLYASARSPSPSSTLGFWGGDTPETRLALWNSAKTYANGTETIGVGDPGVRNVWRNYNDASWMYWTTASISSIRLRSPSLNRFRGHIQTIGGTRSGVTFTATTDYRVYNKCNDSGNAPVADVASNTSATGISSRIDPVDGVTPYGLTPSTIFAPSSAPRNSGRYRGQEWIRWERFLNLRAGRFTNNDSDWNSAGFTFNNNNVGVAPTYPIGAGPYTIAGGSGVGNVGQNISMRANYAINAVNASTLRDSWPNTPGFNSTTNIGWQGQPIRTRIDKSTASSTQSGDSYAGWTTPKADLGGFQFASLITGAPYSNSFVASGGSTIGTASAALAWGVLAEALNIYGVTGTTGAFNAAPAYPVAGHVLYKAWYGNRDNPPGSGFSFTTGTPAYYDHGATIGTVFNATTIDLTAAASNGLSSFTVGNIVNVTDNVTNLVETIATVTTFGGQPRITVTGPSLLTLGATVKIAPNLKLTTSSTVVTQTVCTRTCTLDADGVAGAPITPASPTQKDPLTSNSTNGNLYYAKAGSTCVASDVAGLGATGGNNCTTGAGIPAACSAPVASGSYVTATYGSCAWSGRQSLYVEGYGTYYYGGTCGAASTCTGPGGANAAACPAGRILTPQFFGGVNYRLSNHCQVSGLTNLTINGTAMAGSYLGGNGTQGCSNANNLTAACPTRPGAANPAGCYYVNAGSATAACNQPSPTTVSTGGTTSNDFAVFNMAANDTILYHDCIADNGTTGNPTSGYAKNNADVAFGTSWAATYNATAAATTAPYSTAGSAIAGGNMDVYSVNYLNWQFGPKGPASAPIGRKTRLQIAKDALSGIVATTNGVRFGLMVFNRTALCTNATGSIAPGTNLFTSSNPGFTAGQAIQVLGAGASGATLTTTISSFAANVLDPTLTDFTLGANASSAATTGSIATGSNVVTVANVTGFAVGQRIKINNADPSSLPVTTDLFAFINSINPFSKQLTLSDVATATVAAGTPVSISSYITTMESNPCGGAIVSDGANVARVIKRMGSSSVDLPDYNNRATLISAINAVVAAARTPLTESIYEAYRYFSGRTPKWGTSAANTSSGNPASFGRDPTAICTSTGPGTGCTALGAYASPMLNNPNTANPAGCQKNYVVLITDGGPEDDFSANGDIRNLSWAGPLGTVAARTGLDSTQTDSTTDQFETTPVSGPAPHLPYGPTDLAGTLFDGGYIWLDELTYFMTNADVSPGARNFTSDGSADSIPGRQSVNTYTIGFAGANSPVLQNAALRGNGQYYTADNSAALSAAIIAALAAITNWNPTVAAPTVPISALNRSENATDVYLSFFQPDPTTEWLGTVKKFQLSRYPDNGDATICGSGIGLCLVGQSRLTKSAPNESGVYNIETVTVDTITGITQSEVDVNASSFWAPATVLDGSRPAAGGTGYQLINNTGSPTLLTPETRKVYTFLTNSVAANRGNSGATADLTNAVNKVHMTNTNITKCRLGDAADCVSAGSGTMADDVQETYINWIRGGDVAATGTSCTDGLTATTCTTWRLWPHADVQHSKPAILTYTGAPSVLQYMFYLQNNGLVTAVDTATGLEKWNFMVEEALPQINAMRTDASGGEIYVADGTPTIYHQDANNDGYVNGTDRVYMFFGLRRGGRVYYALDITDPLTPLFKWKIDASQAPGTTAKICVGSGTCSPVTGFNELGQTWSTPFVGKILANANPVLIFGGGYDAGNPVPVFPAVAGDDAQPPGTRSMGRALYVIDAFDTTIIKSWGVGQPGAFIGGGGGSMIYAIPSDVTALNTDLDSQGYIDRIYVGDMRANVWRFDVGDATPSNWNGKLFATLSSDISSGERRKIMFPPAIVKQNLPYRFDAVYVGTGDKEHPLCLTANQVTPTVMTNTCAQFAPQDKMFMVIDKDYGTIMSGGAPNVNAITVADLTQRLTGDLVTNTSASVLNTSLGWYRNLDNGEKVINAATVFEQRLRFGTYAPLGQSGGACVPAGEGRLNEIDALTGDLVPINGAVTQASDRYYSTFITHGYISTGQLIVQGKNIYHIVVSDSRLQSVLVGSLGSATKIYWYMEPEQ